MTIYKARSNNMEAMHLEAKIETDVLVIGGGVAGVCAAGFR
jgi:heterodisulfide reductase subunit A-like polyferredoxin